MNSFAQFFTTHPILRQVNSEPETTAGKAIDINRLCFDWRNSAALVLNIDNLRIERGQRVFIEGPSGSGKSTLLGLLAGIVTPQAGQITVLGRFLDAMSGAAGDRFRADYMGFIFQMFKLIPYLTVTENVTLPCRFSHRRLERVGSNGGVATEAVRLLSRLGRIDPTLLIVDGNPLGDLADLRDYRKKLKLIMKDGKILKNTPRFCRVSRLSNYHQPHRN